MYPRMMNFKKLVRYTFSLYIPSYLFNVHHAGACGQSSSLSAGPRHEQTQV